MSICYVIARCSRLLVFISVVVVIVSIVVAEQEN